VALNTIKPSQFIYIDRMIDQCLKIIHLLKNILLHFVSMCILSTQQPEGSPFYPHTVYKSKTMGTIYGAGMAYSYSSKASEITPIFRVVRFARWLVSCVVFYRSLFVIWFFIFWSFDCLSFDHWIVYLLIIGLSIFWSLDCLSFDHLWLQNTHLVSSNIS
jgi:hypothetical protein